MINQTLLFAHSADQHTESTSELLHASTEWYVAIPLFFGLMLLLVSLLRTFTKLKAPALINMALGIFFVTGILSFSLVPALSVLCITLGIGGALLIVLSSLSH